tara:strand:+ start:711 stop:1589 length:879 start_codon:yes stop_codon:yes gene_type:complete
VVKISLFFNGLRGFYVHEYLKNKKNIKIKNIFIAKKFLNKKLLIKLKKKKIKFTLGNQKKLNSFLNLNKENTELNIFCGFPYIVKKNYFNLTKYGSINLHAGRLPKYRGGSPLNWQIIKGENKIGISVIKMSKGIDTGGIMKEASFKLLIKDDIHSVHKKCNKIFPKITYQSIVRIIKNIKPKKQAIGKKGYFKQRTFKDGKINWKKNNSQQVFNFVRALTFPYHFAYTTFNNKIYFIKKCFEVKNYYNLKKPGNFLIKDNWIIVKTKKNFIKFYNKKLSNFSKNKNNLKFD